MKKIIVLVDDAAHTQGLLDAALSKMRPDDGAHASHDWILVACAPRLTHRVSKWVSHGAREHWRTKWAQKLFNELDPWLSARGVEAHHVLAKGPLQELLDELRPDQVIDARRPKLATAPQSPASWADPRGLRSLAAAFLSVCWVAAEA